MDDRIALTNEERWAKAAAAMSRLDALVTTVEAYVAITESIDPERMSINDLDRKDDAYDAMFDALMTFKGE